MRERKPELAVMRVMGAKPSFVFRLIQIEALSIALTASLSAISATFVALWLGSDWMLANYGLSLSTDIFSIHTATVISVVMVATFLLALAPSISAYRAARLV
jgi:putative ABC transport system permease protein